MNNTAIVVDSTGSLSNELLNEPYIYQVTLNAVFPDGDVYTDTNSETKSIEFYNRMSSGSDLPKTSQPEPAQFIEVFNDIKKHGYENVIFIHLSSAISGTFQTAQMLAQDYEEDFNSYFIDSKGTSLVMENLVEQALVLLDKNVDLDTITEKLQWVADEAIIYLMVENLNTLAKGGRLSKSESLVGNLLSIKPILIVDERGTIEPFEKVRTSKRALKRMNELLDARMKKYNSNAKIFFAHANNEKKVLKQINKLQVTYPDTMYRVAFLTMIIGAHVGEGAIGTAVVPDVTDEF